MPNESRECCKKCPIVCVGVPPATLMPISTLLHEILPHYTEMPVELITEGSVLQPNHVFIRAYPVVTHRHLI